MTSTISETEQAATLIPCKPPPLEPLMEAPKAAPIKTLSIFVELAVGLPILALGVVVAAGIVVGGLRLIGVL